jgi:hypothetical protein
MSMWFFDDAPDWEDYQALRREIKELEREYLEVRMLLQEAESALREHPEDGYLKARVAYYARRRQGLEAKNPRFAADWPLEVTLFTPPHG